MLSFLDNIAERLSEKTLGVKIGLLISSVLLISAGYWYFVWSPNNERLVRLEKKLQAKQKTLAELENVKKSLPEFEREFRRLNKEFKMVSLKLPREEEIPALINSIYSDVSASGLEPLVFAPKGRVPKDVYVEIPIEMKVRGSFHELVNFFDRVSRLPRIVNIKNLKLSKEKKRSTPENVILEAEFTALTFRLLPENEIKEKKEKTRKVKKRGKK